MIGNQAATQDDLPLVYAHGIYLCVLVGSAAKTT